MNLRVSGIKNGLDDAARYCQLMKDQVDGFTVIVVHLNRVDTYNGPFMFFNIFNGPADSLYTILFVHLLQPKEVLSAKPYFLITLVPVCQC
jgi:hypothetical protein